MKRLLEATAEGARYELRCPKAMPHASTFLWNRQMLAQINCRGFVLAQHMQPEPAKYSHAPVLEQKTFMQPELPLYAHHPGRFVYLRNRETGALFSAPHEPVRAAPDAFTFSAGRADVYWTVRKDGVELEMRLALPRDDVAELWTVVVRNRSDAPASLDVFPCFTIGYMSWMNQSARYEPGVGGIVASSITPYQKVEDFETIRSLKDLTVLLHDTPPTAWETCREALEGEGGIQRPDCIVRGQLENGDANYETPIAALQYSVELEANADREFRFIFAPAGSRDEATSLGKKYFSDSGFRTATNAATQAVAANAGAIRIDTPDKDLDAFVNHWLNRQVFYHGDTNRLTTDPQTRNYLQDAMGMAYIDPSHTREAILRTLAQQKKDGALPEGVVLSNGSTLKYINEVPHTDHCVWLPIVLTAYLDETGDESILSETVDAHGRSLSVMDRGILAMGWLMRNRDERGLSLIAQGDWCDPLNMVGHGGKGVSGWLTIASTYALALWSAIARRVGDTELAREMRAEADQFAEAAQKHLWDGGWFCRGISDSGVAFGTHNDAEGSIWLNPQSWAFLAGVASPEQRTRIKSAVREHLATPFGPMMLAPAYTAMQEHIGRVTQKYPGSGENGAIYNHAAAFWIFALYLDGENEDAFAELRRVIPEAEGAHTRRRGQLPTFVSNYSRGAVKQFPRTAGRSSQLFNTGAASWLYRIIIERLFGLRGTVDGLVVDPKLPAHWSHASVTRHFRGATFVVHISRDAPLDELRVVVDGNELDTPIIKTIEAGSRLSGRGNAAESDNMTAPLIVCMGVSGCGKSTCGLLLAASFNLAFIEADDYHSQTNKAKMRAGRPLDDDDREPWMQAIRQQLFTHAERNVGCVLAHSALRRAHREQLRASGLRTLFLHLEVPRDTVARRLRDRADHFMPGELLDSQFAALQETCQERDVIVLNADADRAELMARASAKVDAFLNRRASNAIAASR